MPSSVERQTLLQRFEVERREQYIKCKVHTRLITVEQLLTRLALHFGTKVYKVDMMMDVFHISVDTGAEASDVRGSEDPVLDEVVKFLSRLRK